MPTIRPGQKRYQLVLDEGSEVHGTLLAWAQKRGLTPGRAARCILADWSDAMNGNSNPFALAIAAAAGVQIGAESGQSLSTTASSAQVVMSEQDRALQRARLEAAEQFL